MQRDGEGIKFDEILVHSLYVIGYIVFIITSLSMTYFWVVFSSARWKVLYIHYCLLSLLGM